MNKKPGRNDPCPCGSGKKYKQCCLKKDTAPRKITAKWINPVKQGSSLIERTFADKISEKPEQKD